MPYKLYINAYLLHSKLNNIIDDGENKFIGPRERCLVQEFFSFFALLLYGLEFFLRVFNIVVIY